MTATIEMVLGRLDGLDKRLDAFAHRQSVMQGKMRNWQGSLIRFAQQIERQSSSESLFPDFETVFAKDFDELKALEKQGFSYTGFVPLPTGKYPLLVARRRRQH